MSLSSTLIAELERLASSLTNDDSGATALSLPSIGERIAKTLSVKPEEVAILGISNKWRHLYFLVPQALKNVGYIPLSSPSALAARTAREGKAEINNNFHETRHASVFEGVKAETLSAEAIQKIISAPINFDGKTVGVIQISRKGPSLRSSGADFTSDDLSRLTSICKPLGKLLHHITRE